MTVLTVDFRSAGVAGRRPALGQPEGRPIRPRCAPSPEEAPAPRRSGRAALATAGAAAALAALTAGAALAVQGLGGGGAEAGLGFAPVLAALALAGGMALRPIRPAAATLVAALLVLHGAGLALAALPGLPG